MRIDYYFSLLSPWVYLAGRRLEEIADRHGAEIAWKPFDIGQLVPRAGGQTLGQRGESRRANRLQELRRWAEHLEMPINLAPAHFPTNAAPASCAVIAAARTGGAPGALVAALARAVWVEERDIADDAVIADCLETAGYSPALGGWTAMAESETYAGNLEEALRRGVFGAPSYVVGEEVFWGQDRLAFLDRHLARLG